jgi:hypothetical protein
MDEHPVDEQHLLDENMGENHPIEPSVDAQAPESAMDVSEDISLEPSNEELATEVHPMGEHADDHAMDEHANDHAMEAETELEPQHL